MREALNNERHADENNEEGRERDLYVLIHIVFARICYSVNYDCGNANHIHRTFNMLQTSHIIYK